MSATPHSPITTEQRLPLPLNGTVYTTIRPVATEKPFPQIGGTMEAELGTAWANSRIISAQKDPAKGQQAKQLVIRHAVIPTLEAQLASNWEYSTADLGSTRFPSVSRTFVLLGENVTHDAPASGSAMPFVASDIFDGKDYILVDRQIVRSGMELEPTFRVERRNYIIRQTIGDVTLDMRTGRSKRSITTLYHRTEMPDGVTAIEVLAADPQNAYWGLQAGGVFRELEQLSTVWFAITESTAVPASAVNSLANPAKARVYERVTPIGTDLIFSEKGTMPDPVPAYGSAHYDTAAYPDHTLALISPADETGLLYEFFYVAARPSEDIYNWSHTKADIGGTKFDAVTRTYVTLRSDYTPDVPAMGDTMPDTPSGKFSGTHVLAEKSQQRTGEQKIDNLFVIENRTYVKKIALTDTGYDRATGRAKQSTVTLFYSGETVTGIVTIDTIAADPAHAYLGLQTDGTYREIRQLSEKWWQIVEQSVLPESPINGEPNPAKTRVVRRVTPLGTDVIFTEIGAMPSPTPTYGSAHYDAANWPNHKLTLIEPDDETGLLHRFSYVAARSSQDIYNFSFVKADIGGTKFDSVERTYVTLRSAFTPETPTMGAVMPNVPVNLFDGIYVLAEKRQTRIGDSLLDNLYVAETHSYVKRCTIRQLGVDPLNGKMITSTTTLYYATEAVTGGETAAQLFAAPDNAFWGLQSDGTQRTGQQHSCEWYSITRETVVSGTFTNGAVIIRSYNTVQSYYWPPILSHIAISTWTRRDGGKERQAEPVYLKEGYNGECSAEVVDAFHVEAPTITVPDIMSPMPIYIQNPYIGGIRIAACLFAGDTYAFTNGNDDPIYEWFINTNYIPPTVPTTWPDYVTIKSVQPFRGGYMLSTIKIFKPVALAAP